MQDCYLKTSPCESQQVHPIFSIYLIVNFVLLLGCPANNTPLVEENKKLNKKIIKQEAIITTLQESSRVLQQQVDLLNRELREDKKELNQKLKKAEDSGRGLVSEKEKLSQEVIALTKENQKHKSDAKWLRKQRHTFRESLQINTSGGSTYTLSENLSNAMGAVSKSFEQHGYSLMAKMVTDQKAVLITERKELLSPSIEIPGFRNQYIVLLEFSSKKQTALKAKAQYEKIAQGGKILEVGEKEVAEIELRLIQAIAQAIKKPLKN